MPRHLDIELVRLVNGGLEFAARDVHIRLEGSDAAVCPVVDELLCLLRAAQLVHLEKVAVGSLEIRSGDVDVRTRQAASIDFPTQIQIRIGLDTSRCAHGGHTIREIESGSRKSHLRCQQWLFAMVLAIEVWPRNIEKMVVHSHKA